MSASVQSLRPAQSRHALHAATRFLASLMLAACAFLFPAKDAQAMDVWEALDKVCGQLPELCGSYNSYKAVADACFKGSDELKCAVAVINVASGGQASSAASQVDAIVSCVKAGLPINDTCNNYLKAAGVPGDKINEAYKLVKQCAGIDDVDDAIVCADALLDSSIADEADLAVPTWVNSLFDIYMDLRDKDYWGLVYDVGATVACAVANYFTGTDVCAFLEDIAEFVGDVADGVKAVGGALNNAGEKVFTGQTQHVPVVQFFNEYWLPEVDNYARNIVVQKNSGYWSANVGEKFKHCRNYFDSHTMSEDKASRACSDMRDGTAASDNSFVDKGFSQLASRRGAALLLAGLVKPAATARIAQLRAQGAFKSAALPPDKVALDPWHSAAEVPGAEAVVYRLYGLNPQGGIDDPPMNRDAKTVNEAWRPKTVGFGAWMIVQSAKVAPATLDFATSDGIGRKAVASSEAGFEFAAEVKAFVQTAQAARMKTVDQLVNINKGFQESLAKPLNDMLALCKPKSLASCDSEVRARMAACDAKAKAYYDANQGVIGDFDSSQGKAAINKLNEITSTCQAEVRKYVEALPDGSKFKTIEPAGVGGSVSSTGVGVPKTAIPAAPPTPSGGQTGKAPSGSAPSGNAFKPGGLGLAAPVASSPKIDEAALKQCKPFLGRKDELLCTEAPSFSACKAAVDAKQMKTCRRSGSPDVYSGR